MAINITYGLGGYCAECDPSHDHPLNNIISMYEEEDTVDTVDVQAIAEALSQLPQETLDALKQALGIV